LYRSQGLLSEAGRKYKELIELLERNERIRNRQQLIEGLSRKVSSVESDLKKIQSAPQTPQLPEEVQNLIKKLFAFSKDTEGEGAELEGAIALAKFGQFERAILEFERLLPKDAMRVAAAKNIVKCHMHLSSAQAAVDSYENWRSGELFYPEELEKIRVFTEGLLRKEGVETKLTPPAVGATAAEPQAVSAGSPKPVSPKEPEVEEEPLEINSIGIPFTEGPQKGQLVEFDVSFQIGNMVSLLVPEDKKALIKDLKVGATLDDLLFYSAIAIFPGKGVVSANRPVESGSKKGYHTLDIEIKPL